MISSYLTIFHLLTQFHWFVGITHSFPYHQSSAMFSTSTTSLDLADFPLFTMGSWVHGDTTLLSIPLLLYRVLHLCDILGLRKFSTYYCGFMGPQGYHTSFHTPDHAPCSPPPRHRQTYPIFHLLPWVQRDTTLFSIPAVLHHLLDLYDIFVFNQLSKSFPIDVVDDVSSMWDSYDVAVI
jgi:hypothetical protein